MFFGIAVSATTPSILVSNNETFNNDGSGISIYGTGITATGNYIHDNRGNQYSALFVRSGSIARDNVVTDNAYGVNVDTATLINNRVFNNSINGISLNAGSLLDGNIVYSNGVGIRGTPYNATLRNNLVYANVTAGIWLQTYQNNLVENNTVHQITGDAVRFDAGANNMTLRNNIFISEGGYVYNFAADSQAGVVSDYNLLRATGTAVLGKWGSTTFATLDDWIYNLNLDRHSRTDNPQFVDFDGTDNVLGYSTQGKGPATIIDNGDAAYVESGAGWTSKSGGYQGSYREVFSNNYDRSATYTFSGLTIGQYYQFAATWVAGGGASVRYAIDSAGVVNYVTINQSPAPVGFADAGATWQPFGTFKAYASIMSVTLSGNFSTIRADGIRLQQAFGDSGLDDNYAVLATSPTIDAGDLSSLHFKEPAPNGSRINLGHTGGTSAATPSQVQSIQVLSPNGIEKIGAGYNYSVTWLAAGLTQQRPMALINANGPATENWSADRFLISSVFTDTTTAIIDLSGVTNPAPSLVYQSAVRGSFGAGNKVAYQLPFPDGNYTVRLHFVETTITTVGTRRFDIKLNGTTVQANYDILAAAGARFKAVTASFPVTATGGAGVLIELVNLTSDGALLSGFEVSTPSETGVPNPTVNLEVSYDGGINWNPLAYGVTMDPLGHGKYSWAVGSTESDNVLVRISSQVGNAPVDTSDRPFQVSNGGHFYYVNDVSSAGDVYTTAVGNNANPGKTPNRPMASLYALINFYDLGPGDVVQVDTGTYTLYRNLLMTLDDSGVRVEGPATAVAQFDRTNKNTSSYSVEFAGGDDITLDHLTFFGAYHGVVGNYDTSDSDRVTLSALDIFGSVYDGIYIGRGNEDWKLLNNDLHNNGNYGLEINLAARTLISGNEIFGNYYGITATTDIEANRIVINANLVRDNTIDGIVVQNYVTIDGNTVRGHIGSISRGIYATAASTYIRNNIAYGNQTGIYGSSALVENNRAFNNMGAGFRTAYGIFQGNRSYSNSVGVDVQGTFTLVRNNIIYGNTNQGILIQSASAPTIVNNTIYQPVGDGIRVQSFSSSVTLRNNIIRVLNGTATSVAADSMTNFVTDHNVTADPFFVDIDGADNVLGYRSSDQFDGGLDDNFYPGKNSPAIDAADSWNAPYADALGYVRFDDPGLANAGTNDYFISQVTATAPTGTAKNWKSDDTFFTSTIPFNFPFFGTNYTTAYVSTNGFLQVGNATQAFNGVNSLAEFIAYPRIAPLWDDLRTDTPGSDIYVDSSIANQITVRWQATLKSDGSPVNAAVTLFSTGAIRFDYGAGNANLSPTVGISMGNNNTYRLASYDGMTNLNSAKSLSFNLLPGVTDLGAYEFRGSSLDVIAPTVLTVTPGPLTGATAYEIRISLSEQPNPIDAIAIANFELRDPGPDGKLGTGDDVLYLLVPTYIPLDTAVTLSVPGGYDTSKTYRLTISGTAGLRDLSGLKLDGNSDGTGGDNFVFTGLIQGPGLNINPTTGLTAAEGGAGSIFAVALTSRPSADVVVTFAPDGQLSSTPLMLTFTPSNWDVPQNVNVNAVNDNVTEGPHFGQLGFNVTSADSRYQGLIIPSMSVAITDNDTAPSDINLSNATIAENSMPGLLVGMLSTTDIDPYESFTYSLLNSAGRRFAVVGNQLYVGGGGPLDFEAQPTHLIRVRTTDSTGRTFDKDLIITLTNVNEAPTDVILTPNSVGEHMPVGTTVGLLAAVDPDVGRPPSFAIVGGNGQALFQIVDNELRTSTEFNFETQASWTVRVRATDRGGLFVERDLVVNVIDRLEPRVESVQVNDGSAQRSSVTSLTVTFNTLMAVAPGAFSLTRQSDGMAVVLAVNLANVSGKTVATLTFVSGPVSFGGLQDGRYTLTINAASAFDLTNNFTLDGDADTIPGGDYVLIGNPTTNKLYRLFGDADGNGTVNSTDFAVFRTFFGVGPSIFDFDGDGQTNSSDFAEFRKRFGVSI
jgi:parallel beta-helix repeat protein